jgi:NAD(P)-dependent dehydrogenase (short-subunit alcohol dehydrogenase family)
MGESMTGRDQDARSVASASRHRTVRAVAVTGACGKTGRHVIAALRAAGHPVRAMLRREPGGDDHDLDDAGIEVVTGDMRDRSAVTRLFEGASVAYHIPPNMSDEEPAIVDAVVAAAASTGLELSMHSNSHLGISLAAMVQAGAVMPSLHYSCDTHYPWVDEDIVDAPAIKDGVVSVGEAPGLGVALDRDQLARLHERWRSAAPITRDDVAAMRRHVEDWEDMRPRC